VIFSIDILINILSFVFDNHILNRTKISDHLNINTIVSLINGAPRLLISPKNAPQHDPYWGHPFPIFQKDLFFFFYRSQQFDRLCTPPLLFWPPLLFNLTNCAPTHFIPGTPFIRDTILGLLGFFLKEMETFKNVLLKGCKIDHVRIEDCALVLILSL